MTTALFRVRQVTNTQLPMDVIALHSQGRQEVVTHALSCTKPWKASFFFFLR